MADPLFADLLHPGEAVLAQIAGEGRRAESHASGGMERTWWHVALTQTRLLVVRMRAAHGTDRWEVASRLAGPRQSVRIAHFPRTGADTARLTIDGCGERIVLVDVDRPPLLQQVQPFLAAWGGPVAGGESVATEEVDAYHGDGREQKTFLWVAVGLLAAFFLCCGCLGLLGVVKQLFGVVFEI